MPGRPLWIWEAIYFFFECITLAHLLSDPKSYFECNPKEEKALQQVQAAVQATLPLELQDAADPAVLEGAAREAAGLITLETFLHRKGNVLFLLE